MKRVYLDHNATTPMDPVVRARWLEVQDELVGNPSSLHAGGRWARDLIDRAREQVAGALRVHEEEVIFTSGGTESNNVALRGVMAAQGPEHGLVTSAIEHSSVLETARALADQGHPLSIVPVDDRGCPDFDTLANHVARPETVLVSMHAANNEIGTLFDLQHVADVCSRTATSSGREIILHTDAVQALGRVPIDPRAWGVNLVSLSAHKVGGPVGVGVLLRTKGTRMHPLLTGGGHEGGLRAGTEDVAGIVSAALAIERAVEQRASFAERTHKMCRTLWHDLCGNVPNARLVGPALDSQERLPNTLAFLVPGEDGKVLITRLDLEGVAVGAGSACASGSLEPSHVLSALGYDEDEARAALRVSLGATTTEEDCRVASDVFQKVFASSRAT